jgi:hypothetical protein
MTRNTPSFLIRDIKPGDLEHLADNLRNTDKAELAAASGTTNFLSRLTLSVDLSEDVKIVEAEGLPVLVFGYEAIGPDTKAIWFVGTNRVGTFRRPLVERSRKVIREWFQRNPTIHRMESAIYTKSRSHWQWLESIGAELVTGAAVLPIGFAFQR